MNYNYYSVFFVPKLLLYKNNNLMIICILLLFFSKKRLAISYFFVVFFVCTVATGDTFSVKLEFVPLDTQRETGWGDRL